MYIGSLALLIYALCAFGTLAVLGWMILKIGSLLGDCPLSRARAKAASVTIATGYLAIGAGGVVLGGAAAVYLSSEMVMVIGVLGFVMLCLGLGFSNAIATLRAVVAPPQAQERQDPVDPFADDQDLTDPAPN